jgi:uncharacterized protein YjiS (DUF1127 family)
LSNVKHYEKTSLEPKEAIMFTRLVTLLQLRRSTAFLLERADDRLLDDIGLTRADLEALRRGSGLRAARPQPKTTGLTLPVAG